MLNYNKVLEILINHGILPSLTVLKYPGIIIELGSELLNKLGLMANNQTVLLITKENDQFHYYEQNVSSPFDGGDEGWVWAGTNIKTGEAVAIKSGYHLPPPHSPPYQDLPAGWRLAKERLNQYPYFVKSHAIGFVHEVLSNNLTVVAVKDKPVYGFVKLYQIMEMINVGFKLVSVYQFRLWTGSQIQQLIVDGLDAYECFDKEKITGFDPHPTNYLVDNNGRLKLCDFNPLFSFGENETSWPLYSNAIDLLIYLYGYYRRTLERKPAQIAAAKMIDNILSQFRKNVPHAKEEIVAKLREIIALCEKQKCIIQCESEDDGAINQIKANHTKQLGVDEFCPIFCEIVDLENNRTMKEKIIQFTIPQTRINWSTVSSHVLQSSALTFSTELIKDGLKYYSAPGWLNDTVDHVIKDAWMWSQGSAYAALTTSMSMEICDALGLSTNVKAAISITTGLCTNAIMQYPTTTIATSVVSSIASLLTSSISFWGEKKLVKRLGVININAERFALLKSQQDAANSGSTNQSHLKPN